MPILTRDDIKSFGLIEKGIDECFKPTTYDLRLGDLYISEDGTRKLLTLEDPDLKIEAHQAVIISTEELVRLPQNVLARYDLKLKLGLEGLILQNGTQVEPGYYGKLFTLVFNLSDQAIILRYPETKIFAIEFSQLAKYADVKVEQVPFVTIDRWASRRQIRSGLRDLQRKYNRMYALLVKGLPIAVTVCTALFLAEILEHDDLH